MVVGGQACLRWVKARSCSFGSRTAGKLARRGTEEAGKNLSVQSPSSPVPYCRPKGAYESTGKAKGWRQARLCAKAVSISGL